jgi:hypothetical protein
MPAIAAAARAIPRLNSCGFFFDAWDAPRSTTIAMCRTVDLPGQSAAPAAAIAVAARDASASASYDPPFIFWGSYQKLPERAKKYLRGHDSFPGSKEQYRLPITCPKSWRIKIPLSSRP